MKTIVGDERSWLLTRIATHTNMFPMMAAMTTSISTVAVTR